MKRVLYILLLFVVAMQRRQFMKATGTVAAGTLVAGCTSPDNEDDSTPEEKDANAQPAENSSGTSSGSGDSSSGKVEILSDEFVDNGEYDKYVEGTVQNVSGEELGFVEVQVKFKDSEGTRIGEGLDNTTDLPADEKWDFKAALLDEGEVDSYTIEASGDLL